MKKILSLFALIGVFTINPVYAQNSKAKAIMKKVSTNLKNAKAISANFSLSVIDGQGKTLMSKDGSFQMKGNKYKVSLKDGQQIICDAKSVWTYLPKMKEVQVSKYHPESQTISPAKLFTGSYEKDYSFSYSGTKTVKDKKVSIITLKPKKANPSFTKVNLYINTATDMIAGGHVYTNSGSSYSYSVSNVNTNASISNSEFTFNSAKHQGVEVIDLR